MRWLALTALLVAGLPSAAQAATPQLVVWAWERPEDLRFLGPDAEIAVESGFIVLAGEGVFVRGRRVPLRSVAKPATVVIHLQIDHHRALAWSKAQRAAAAAAVLRFAHAEGAPRVQVDFEVRQSERQVLLDLLSDVRAGLPAEIRLSMTALASWCETEAWLNRAPVDEIVPMLFRMGPDGAGLKGKLEAGGDFAQPRCRSALAVSAQAPLRRAPVTGRRIYLFNPRSWTPLAFARMRREVEAWASADR